MTAFGPDDRAKVSALTSGADPRSTGPTPYLHRQRLLASTRSWRCADGPLARPARMGHRRLASGWPRCAGCQEPVRSSARRQAPRLGQQDAGLRFPLFGKPSSLGLTVREAEVLALVAEGQTNRQIGQALFILPRPPAPTSHESWPSWESLVAARQPRSPTGSAWTSHDPLALGCSTPAPGSATSDLGGRPTPIQVLTPPAAQPGRGQRQPAK
jgi:Bacterial regulatory proteins, luxR family